MIATLTARQKHEVELSVLPDCEACFNGLSRTEDLALSPNNQWLAVANFTLNCITFFQLSFTYDGSPRTPGLSIGNYWQLQSPTLKYPHGLDFLDDQTLVVANRQGSIDLFDLPAAPPFGQMIKTTPRVSLTRAGFKQRVHSPGSVCAVELRRGQCQIFAANNYSHFISSHVISSFGQLRKTSNKTIISSGLGIPDGLAMSDDHRFLAVSNHTTHEVLIYKNQRAGEPFDEPCARLKNVIYPHGLKFVDGHSKMVVASAGSPFLHLYACDDLPWSGEYRPKNSFQVVDDETFRAGAVNDQEGGPKGIEITSNERLLLMTNELLPLRVFDLQAMLNS
ncbi:MAG: hypothetical protein AAGI12_09295 [Pseudomonadota bacterium]